MPLILKVTSYCTQPPEQALSTRFDGRGGVIGRALQSDLCLPDPGRYVSRRHAEVHYHAGSYFVADVGAGNPVCLNGTAIARGCAEQICDGDYLHIGDYHLRASVSPDAELFSDNSASFTASVIGLGQPPEAWDRIEALAPEGDASAGSLTDLLVGARTPVDVGCHGLPYRGSEADVLPEIFAEMPGLDPSPGTLPKDYDFLRGVAIDTSESAAVTAHSERLEALRTSRQTPPEDDDGTVVAHAAEVQELISGAINESGHSRRAMALIREFIVGLQAVFDGRARVRAELGIDSEVLGHEDHNSVLTVPDADAALQELLHCSNTGVGPAELAVRAAFLGIQSHEIALMAGSRAIVFALLQRFDPEVIGKRQRPPSLLERLLPRLRESRDWRSHVEQHKALGEDGGIALNKLFSDEFTRGYIEQLQRLQAAKVSSSESGTT
jgi:type VI secretion system FHA domain protein